MAPGAPPAALVPLLDGCSLAAQIGQHAAKIAETVASGYMPLANLTHISDAERKLIATWFAQGATLAN